MDDALHLSMRICWSKGSNFPRPAHARTRMTQIQPLWASCQRLWKVGCTIDSTNVEWCIAMHYDPSTLNVVHCLHVHGTLYSFQMQQY